MFGYDYDWRFENPLQRGAIMPDKKLRELSRLLDLADLVGIPLIIRIAEAVCKARKAHPEWGERGYSYAVKVVRSEMLEWEAQASLVDDNGRGRENPDRLARAEAEAMDVIVTLIRYLCADYKQGRE